MRDLHLGREIYVFFFSYGKKGLCGIILSIFLTTLIIYKSFYITKKNKCRNYSDFLNRISNRKNDTVKSIINIFLLISFFIMVAGFSTYLKQEFNIPITIGSIIITIICGYIFTKNTEGITRTNVILVPLLIALIYMIGIRGIHSIDFKTIEVSNRSNWIVSTVIYCSYNSIILIPILVTLKEYIVNKKNIIIICISSFFILTSLAIIIYMLLTTINIDINSIEMPVVYVAASLGTPYKYIYGIVILASIFTSAVSAGFGFIKNIIDNANSKIIIFICSIAVIISNFGFSNLVNFLYPIFGYLGLLQLFLILKKR